MTLQTKVSITCDRCGKTRISYKADFEGIRDSLYNKGWVYVKSTKEGGHGMDYCPKCAKAMQEEC